MKFKFDIKKFKKKFDLARSTYDLTSFADCMVELFQIQSEFMKNNLKVPAEFMKFYKHIDAYSYVVINELGKHNGENAVKYHAGLKNLLSGIEKIILVGGLWRDAFNNDPEYIYLNSWQEALSEIKKFDWSGILIKGSNSIGLSNIVKAL